MPSVFALLLLACVFLMWVCAPSRAPRTELFSEPEPPPSKRLAIPPQAREHSPKHYDKSNDYFDKFLRAEAVLHSATTTRVKRRAFADLMMLAARTMKHLLALRSWLPNDLALEKQFRECMDSTETFLHHSMQRASTHFDINKEEVYMLHKMSLHCSKPFGANYYDYIK